MCFFLSVSVLVSYTTFQILVLAPPWHPPWVSGSWEHEAPFVPCIWQLQWVVGTEWMLVTGKAFQRFLNILVPLCPSVLTHSSSQLAVFVLDCGPLFRVGTWLCASVFLPQCYAAAKPQVTRERKLTLKWFCFFAEWGFPGLVADWISGQIFHTCYIMFLLLCKMSPNLIISNF